MHLNDIINSLANGFHDAKIYSIAIDYIKRIINIEIDIWIGDRSFLEAYRRCRLILNGFVYFVVEAPQENYPYDDNRGLAIDVYEQDYSSFVAKTLPRKFDSDAFAYRMYVGDWNSFIHFAAVDAELHWTGEVTDGPSYPTE